jgi:anti-sigma factor RsiW
MKDGTPHDRDPALDALIRAVIRDPARETSRAPQDAPPFDASDLLDYVAGRAEPALAERIRAALAESPAMRRHVMEIAADLDRLEEATALGTFEEIDPGPVPDRGAFLGEGAAPEEGDGWERRRPGLADVLRERAHAWLGGLRTLFLRPAFAYAFTVLLLAYPTVRFFAGGRSGAPLLQPTRHLALPAGELTLRGEGDLDVPVLPSGDGAAAVVLTLWSEEPLQPGARYALVVEGPEGVLWRDDDVPVSLDPSAPGRLELRLDAGALPAGLIIIRVSRFDRATGELLLREDYAFRKN